MNLGKENKEATWFKIRNVRGPKSCECALLSGIYISAEETSCDLQVLGVMIVKRLEIFDCTKINAKNHYMLEIKSCVAHTPTCGDAVDVYISAARGEVRYTVLIVVGLHQPVHFSLHVCAKCHHLIIVSYWAVM